MMRVSFALFCLAVLVACDGAGPGYRGQEKTVIEVEGSRFTLRRRGDVVEAIRTNPEWLPNLAQVGPKAAFAAEQMTGCVPVWLQGDPAMMWVGLSCEGRPAPPMPKRRKVLDCDLTNFHSRGGLGTGSLNCVES